MLTIEDILRDLERYCDFPDPENIIDDNDIITEGNYRNIISIPLRNATCCFQGEPFSVEAGASKICIVFDNLPFVIKIPLMGRHSYDYINGDTMHLRGSCYYIPESKRTSSCYYFSQTRVDSNELFSDEDWNYCDHEEYISDLAIEEGLADFFAKEECIGYINNYPIYKQEKVEVYASSNFRNKPSSKDTYSLLDDIITSGPTYLDVPFCDLDEDREWLAQALEYHGEEQFMKFLDFIERTDINDLHSGNMGYIGNRPVLLDYSGFWN